MESRAADAHQAEASGARVFIPRLGIVLGPEGGALRQMVTPFQFYAGGPIGSGRQFTPWIHLHDLAELLVTAMEDERCRGAAIAAAPNPIRNRDFARALGQALGRATTRPSNLVNISPLSSARFQNIG